MKKKIIGLLILFILLFSLTACNQVLTEYKGDAKLQIGNSDRVTNNISDDIVVGAAKEAIDGMKKDVDMNKSFYNLQHAYYKRWLTKEDIESIAYCRKNGTGDVIPKTIENDIKQAYLDSHPRDGMTVDSVVINGYFGTYNDCVALMIGYIDSVYITAIHREVVAGVEFIYGSSQRILIYKKSCRM